MTLRSDAKVIRIITPHTNHKRENFLVGSWLLSPKMRPPIHAFYRLARFGDDVADDPNLQPHEKNALLNAMEAGIHGAPPMPHDSDSSLPHANLLGRNFAEKSQIAGVATDEALAMLMAFRRDVAGEHFQDCAQLLDYCRYSAMSVGRYILSLHGLDAVRDPAAFAAADNICAALQWFNHIQDCGDDYRSLRRIYLPQMILSAHAVKPDDLAAKSLSPALRAALSDWLLVGEQLWQAGACLPDYCHAARLRAESAAIVSLARSLAKRLRHSLEKDDLFDRRAGLYRIDYPRAMLAGMIAAYRRPSKPRHYAV